MDWSKEKRQDAGKEARRALRRSGGAATGGSMGWAGADGLDAGAGMGGGTMVVSGARGSGSGSGMREPSLSRHGRWWSDAVRDGSGVLEEPASDLRDGGAFGVTVGRLVGEGGVPSGGEASAGSEVAGLRGQEDGFGGGHDAAHTKFGVHEGATHDVHVVVRGVGARVGGIEQGLRGEGFEVKERVRELIKAMGDTNELLPF